jgi:hypothetical protein
MRVITLLALGSICFASSMSVYADSCPPPEQLQYGIPSGWHWIRGTTMPDLHFILAAWGSTETPNPDVDNHVRCYYGDKDKNIALAIETNNIIEESNIEGHGQWGRLADYKYFMCETYNVSDCNFN